MRVVLLLVRRLCKLPFLGVDDISSLGVDAVAVLANHDYEVLLMEIQKAKRWLFFVITTPLTEDTYLV